MKKKPTPKTERRFGSFWICPNCEDHPELEHKEMMAHMKEKHGIDRDAKGKRKMLCHMDGDTWFSSDYEWEINGLKFVQHTCTKRTGDNLAMWR